MRSVTYPYPHYNLAVLVFFISVSFFSVTYSSEPRLPDNSSLNYSGDGWVCNRGYKRSGDKCTQVGVLSPKRDNEKISENVRNWEKVEESLTEINVYLDLSSKVIDGDQITVWQLTDYIKPTDQNILSIKILRKINCKSKEARKAVVFTYDGPMAMGNEKLVSSGIFKGGKADVKLDEELIPFICSMQ